MQPIEINLIYSDRSRRDKPFETWGGIRCLLELTPSYTEVFNYSQTLKNNKIKSEEE